MTIPQSLSERLRSDWWRGISNEEIADALDAKDRRYKQLLGAFSELQAAAQKVVDETDRIHDSEPWPVKYCAPYAAIVELRQLLAKQYGLRG